MINTRKTTCWKAKEGDIILPNYDADVEAGANITPAIIIQGGRKGEKCPIEHTHTALTLTTTLPVESEVREVAVGDVLLLSQVPGPVSKFGNVLVLKAPPSGMKGPVLKQ